jgi:hypothetical protein
MHRLNTLSLSLLLVTLAACGGKPAEDPSKLDTEPSGATTAKEGDDGEGADGPKKDADCVGFDIASLDDALLKSACEVPNGTPDGISPVDLKGKIVVSASPSPTKVAPGGKADLLVSFVNKTKEPITLSFRIDPTPRFEIEVYDKKEKRVDMPAGDPPPPPKDHTPPPAADPKIARVTITPNGSARQTIPWEAVKMKWAPEKVRGTPAERGFPRKPAGPLPKGKYTVKVVTPLVGVSEGPEHELTAPKFEIEIGG